MRKGRAGTHLKLHPSLIDALENIRNTSFLFLVVRDLPDKPLFAQLDQFIQFFFKGAKYHMVVNSGGVVAQWLLRALKGRVCAPSREVEGSIPSCCSYHKTAPMALPWDSH